MQVSFADVVYGWPLDDNMHFDKTKLYLQDVYVKWPSMLHSSKGLGKHHVSVYT